MHGDEKYHEIVFERLSKLEQQREREEQERQRLKREKEAEFIMPELSDEEANEDIRRALAEAKKQKSEEQKSQPQVPALGQQQPKLNDLFADDPDGAPDKMVET